MTLNYGMKDDKGYLADITVSVNDTYLRTDYQLKREKLTELTIKWDAQYVIDHRKKRAYFIDFDTANKKGDAAFSAMASQSSNFTKEQIFAMSIDPENDESEYIEYTQSGDNKLTGRQNSDFIHEIGYLEVPNKYVTQEQYDWLLSRSREDRKFGQAFVMVLDQPITEVIRRLNYQYPVFPVYLRTEKFTLFLKSVNTDTISPKSLGVGSGILKQDITDNAIQFLGELSRLYTQKP
ncbi:hypothetical protein [Pseudoalteromonas sp. TB64]|uniref:hypothetical protein n=1 Tax=Pseudoalteromonas sp. TB64 TaxID=1938600 RepID=UPI001110FBBF|nr:hypothetical protein [Pseudoalteromonas sp. TB64]